MNDKTLAGRVGRLEESQMAVHDALLGTPELQMDGTTIRLDDGLVAKVGLIEERLVNGMKVRIPKAVWAAVWAAIISGVAQIVAAVV